MTKFGEPLLLRRPDAVEHLKLEVSRATPMITGQLETDVDQGGIMSSQHRETLPRHQDLHAAYVRLVDLLAILECHAVRLRVGPFAEPHPRSRYSQISAVVFGPV